MITAGFPLSAIEDLEIPFSFFNSTTRFLGAPRANISCLGSEQRITECDFSQISADFIIDDEVRFEEDFAGIRCIGELFALTYTNSKDTRLITMEFHWI